MPPPRIREVTREVATKLRGQGVDYADAPVTGGPVQAAAGTLGALVGCTGSSFPRIRGNRCELCKDGATHRWKSAAGTTPSCSTISSPRNHRAACRSVRPRARQRRRLAGALCGDGSGRGALGNAPKKWSAALDGNFDGSQFTASATRSGITSYFCRQAQTRRAEATRSPEDPSRFRASGGGHGLADRYVSALLDPDTQHQKANLS